MSATDIQTNQTQPAQNKPIAPSIWLLALCTGSAVVGLTILTPALPLIKSELDVSDESVQQLLSAYLIALAVGQLFLGPISDRTGRRPILLAGALLFSLTGVAAMFTQSIGLLVLLRFVQGLGAAACMAMGRAIINDVYARDDAARQMSTISTILAIAPALSLAFGGILAQSTGWKGTMVVLSISGLVLFVSAYILVSESNLNRLRRLNLRSVFAAYAAVIRKAEFLCWTMAGAMQIGIFFSLNAFLAYQYQRNGYSMAEFGLWFALTPLSYIVGNTLNRIWFVNRGIERTALLGCLLSLISVLLLLTTQAFGYTHALSLALPCALFGFSNGIIIANSTAGAMSSAGKHAGTGTGLIGAWQMATGGIAGTIIVALGGAQVFAIAMAVLIAMSVMAVLSMLYIYRYASG